MDQTQTKLRKKKRHQKKLRQGFPNNMTKHRRKKLSDRLEARLKDLHDITNSASLEDRSHKLASIGLDDKVTVL